MLIIKLLEDPSCGVWVRWIGRRMVDVKLTQQIHAERKASRPKSDEVKISSPCLSPPSTTLFCHSQKHETNRSQDNSKESKLNIHCISWLTVLWKNENWIGSMELCWLYWLIYASPIVSFYFAKKNTWRVLSATRMNGVIITIQKLTPCNFCIWTPWLHKPSSPANPFEHLHQAQPQTERYAKIAP